MATQWLCALAGACLLLGCGSLEESLRRQTAETRLAPNQPSSPNQSPGHAKSPATISVSTPTQEAPLSAAALMEPASVGAGQSATLHLRCLTLAPWYIYAAEGPVGVATPTQLELKLPAGVRQAGEWQLPPAHTKSTPLGEVATYAQDVHFSVPLEIDAGLAAGNYDVACVLHYQACSDTSCLPPKSLTIPLTMRIAAAK